ncbi:MAG: AbrB/MazE/SpoVT family DNA-binding domain-containing protein [Myxococcota bacterium]
MTKKVKIRRLDGAITAHLPEELSERLGLEDGDELTVTETEHGFFLSTDSTLDDDILAAYKKGAEKYRNALQRLSE